MSGYVGKCRGRSWGGDLLWESIDSLLLYNRGQKLTSSQDTKMAVLTRPLKNTYGRGNLFVEYVKHCA